MALLLWIGIPAAQQYRLRLEQLPDPAQAVHARSRAGGDEVDDGVREAEARGRLHGPRDRNEFDRDAGPLETGPCRGRIRRRNAQALEVGESGRHRVDGHRRLQRATGEAELGKRHHVRLALDDQVGTGDARIDDSVLDVLRNVVRADE